MPHHTREPDPRQGRLGIDAPPPAAPRVVTGMSDKRVEQIKAAGKAMWAGAGRRRLPKPTEEEAAAAVAAFKARGGAVTVCPARCVAAINGGSGLWPSVRGG
jgi:hypothetical protein